MTPPAGLVIIGCGAHARVVHEALEASGRAAEVAGFLDLGDGSAAPAEVHGRPVLGRAEDLERLAAARGWTGHLVATGENAAREAWSRRAEAAGLPAAVACVHPAARVSHRACVGPGAVIAAGAVVAVDARVERGAIVNTGATVDHDGRVGPYSHLAPGAHLAGRVTLGARAFVGVGAAVVQGVGIGADAVVGAGAVVLRDVPPGETHVGVPARRLERPPRKPS